MQKPDVESIAKGMIEATGAFVSKALGPLKARVVELEAKIAAIPAGPKGEKGDPGGAGTAGAPGERGADGASGPHGEAGPRGEMGETGETGATGEPGAPGERGADGAPGPRGEAGLRGESGEAGAAGPAGKDGLLGPQGPQGIAGERGADGPRGETGESIKGEVGLRGERGEPGARGERGEVGLQGERGVKGDLGEPGRDAAELDILPSIDEAKSYRRGTWASHNGGLIRAARQTDVVKDGAIIDAGWVVMVEGIAAVVVTQGEDPRALEVAAMLTSGTKAVCGFTLPVMIYREVWREGEYARGDVVTWGGSAWHCQQQTTDKPGTSAAWRLMVKEGARGKDGDARAAGPREPVRLR